MLFFAWNVAQHVQSARSKAKCIHHYQAMHPLLNHAICDGVVGKGSPSSLGEKTFKSINEACASTIEHFLYFP